MVELEEKFEKREAIQKIKFENHEKDLEASVNNFLSELEGEVIEIKYQVAVGVFSEEQVFCFSAMIIYT